MSEETKCPRCGGRRVHEELVTVRVADEGGFKFIDTTITHCADCTWWSTPEMQELQAEVERLRAVLKRLESCTKDMGTLGVRPLRIEEVREIAFDALHSHPNQPTNIVAGIDVPGSPFNQSKQRKVTVGMRRTCDACSID